MTRISRAAGAALLAIAFVACGPAAPGGVAAHLRTAAPTPTPTPTPAPTLLTVQPDYTVTDTDHVTITGTATPGATISASGAPTGISPVGASDKGAFSITVTGLLEGDTYLTLTATAPGMAPASQEVAIHDTISEGAYKAKAQSIAYSKLDRDPASLKGTIVVYKAQVFQYDTATTTSHMIVSVTDDGYGYWSDNVWLDLDPSLAASACKGTVIQLWGAVAGAYTYTTTMNGQMTIPEIQVKYLSVLSNGC